MAVFKDLKSKQDIFDLIDRFEKSSLFELEISIPPEPPPANYTKIKMMKLSQYTPEETVRVTIEDSDGSKEDFNVGRGISDAPPSPKDKSANIIKSPLVGTFYASPSPESEAYAKPGDKIAKGMVLCIIEAMKTMNEIECEADCEIAEVLVKNGDVVEYGQPLFRVK